MLYKLINVEKENYKIKISHNLSHILLKKNRDKRNKLSRSKNVLVH